MSFGLNSGLDQIDLVTKDLEEYKNVVYINGTRKFPLCTVSAMICSFIEQKKQNDIKFISVDNNLTLANELKKKSIDVPALFYNGKLVACGEKLKQLIKSSK